MPKGEVAADPRGLIHEAYQMDLGPEDCRTIFLDWALGLPEVPGKAEIRALLEHYGPQSPGHPMTALLRAGLEANAAPRRRDRRRRP